MSIKKGKSSLRRNYGPVTKVFTVEDRAIEAQGQSSSSEVFYHNKHNRELWYSSEKDLIHLFFFILVVIYSPTVQIFTFCDVCNSK